jgi:hypothetical protein
LNQLNTEFNNIFRVWADQNKIYLQTF